MVGLLNPFVFGASGGGGGVGVYGTAEDLAEDSTTGDTLTGATITTTLQANTKYMFCWSQDVQLSVTSANVYSHVDIDGNNVSVFANDWPQLAPREVGSPVDYQTMGGVFVYQEGASPAQHTFAVVAQQFGAGTIKQRNSRLSYLKLGADDKFSESLTRQTFTNPGNKTAQTACQLTFTPPTAGDYIIFVYATLDLVNASNVYISTEITDGTTSTGEVWHRPPANNDRLPFLGILKLGGISGAKTIDFKVRQPDTGTTTIGVSEIRMIAIRCDRFASSPRYVSLGSNNSGTDSAYVTAVSQTFTPTAGDHLTIAGWGMSSTSTTASAYSQYLDEDVSVNEYIREFGLASTPTIPAASHRLAAYPGTSRTQAIQRHGEGSVNNHIQYTAAIVTFELTGLT